MSWLSSRKNRLVVIGGGVATIAVTVGQVLAALTGNPEIALAGHVVGAVVGALAGMNIWGIAHEDAAAKGARLPADTAGAMIDYALMQVMATQDLKENARAAVPEGEPGDPYTGVEALSRVTDEVVGKFGITVPEANDLSRAAYQRFKVLRGSKG